MAKKKIEVPEILQLRGYKYRAKMILGALVVLVVIISIIVSIINGISPAIHKDSDNISSDTDSATSTVSKLIDSESDSEISLEVSTESTISSDTDSEILEFDADGKLIIDTDSYDGNRVVAITFDDGPGEYTERLINELNKRNVRATFFMLGSCISKYPNVLPKMVEGGHQIGSHSYEHLDITKLSNQELNNQISKTDEAIYNACGQTATAFRPPYGSYTDSIVSPIDKTVTMWSLDTLDWESRDADSVKEMIVNNAQDGDIILLHDIYNSSVEGALAAIDELQADGFVFVTVDELISRFGYDVEHGQAYFSQYAVYETNSPHAEKYEAEMAASAAEQASNSASSEFYYESTDSQDTNSNSNTYSDDESDLIY